MAAYIAPNCIAFLEYLRYTLDMIQCNTCREHKPENDFNWKNREAGVRQPFCKECQAMYSHRWYDKNKSRLIEKSKKWKVAHKDQARQLVNNYLSQHPCVDCGETDIVVLEFDHISGSKDYDVSAMVMRGHRPDRIKTEMEKCEVRCANCHRRRHATLRLLVQR